jgi:putative SOS response-associated peptidase YedK
MPIVVGDSPNRLDIMLWGLVPFRAKQEGVGDRMINARAETLAERPTYRAALRYHRCLVPANGYYEWRTTPAGREPYVVHLPDEPLLAFAGLSDVWYSPDGGEGRTYTIITCEPNAVMAPIHNRMPAILPREAEAAWLDPAETRAAAVLPLLRPYPAERMATYRVSTAVNSKRNEGPALIAPLSLPN